MLRVSERDQDPPTATNDAGLSDHVVVDVVAASAEDGGRLVGADTLTVLNRGVEACAERDRGYPRLRGVGQRELVVAIQVTARVGAPE